MKVSVQAVDKAMSMSFRGKSRQGSRERVTRL